MNLYKEKMAFKRNKDRESNSSQDDEAASRDDMAGGLTLKTREARGNNTASASSQASSPLVGTTPIGNPSMPLTFPMGFQSPLSAISNGSNTVTGGFNPSRRTAFSFGAPGNAFANMTVSAISGMNFVNPFSPASTDNIDQATTTAVTVPVATPAPTATIPPPTETVAIEPNQKEDDEPKELAKPPHTSTSKEENMRPDRDDDKRTSPTGQGDGDNEEENIGETKNEKENLRDGDSSDEGDGEGEEEKDDEEERNEGNEDDLDAHPVANSVNLVPPSPVMAAPVPSTPAPSTPSFRAGLHINHSAQEESSNAGKPFPFPSFPSFPTFPTPPVKEQTNDNQIGKQAPSAQIAAVSNAANNSGNNSASHNIQSVSRLFPDDSVLNNFCHPAARAETSLSHTQVPAREDVEEGEPPVRVRRIPGTNLTIPLAPDWEFDPMTDGQENVSFTPGSKRDEDWEEHDRILKNGLGFENSYGVSLILPDPKSIRRLPPPNISSSIMKVGDVVQTGYQVSVLQFTHTKN